MHWTRSFYENDEEEIWCYSQMNKIIHVSDISRTQFGKLFPGIKISQQVIHNPIDREEIINGSELISISKSKFTICSVGRLVEPKGYLRLIPIISQLILSGFDFEFWIIGEGKQKQEIEDLIRQYSLENVVYLKGFHRNPYPYIKASDVFVLASYSEGFGLSLCEAICLGKPVLATQTAGTVEILDKGKYGLIVAQDTQSIYEGLKRLIEDKQLRESLSNKALIHSEIIFDHRKIIDQIHDLLKEKSVYE
jgi:glycosyltransferase involved in cell wall biosynthesis